MMATAGGMSALLPFCYIEICKYFQIHGRVWVDIAVSRVRSVTLPDISVLVSATVHKVVISFQISNEKCTYFQITGREWVNIAV